MTDWTLNRRDTLRTLGVTTAGMFGISAVAGQNDTELTVTVDPSDVTVLSSDTVTIDVVLLDASEGVEGYDFELRVDDPAVARVVSFTEFRGQFSGSRIIDEGAAVRFETALGDNKYQGAEEVVIATVTLSGESAGETAVAPAKTVIQDNNSNEYQTVADPGSLTVESDDRALSAAFDWEPAEPQVGQDVTLDAADSTGEIAEYSWMFGDGTETSATTPLVAHTYDEPGEYDVTLEVVSENGDTDQISQQVLVTGSGAGVTAAFDWEPDNPQAGEVVSFDASNASGDIVEYRWDLTGDGNRDETSETSGVVYVYSEPGEYEVTLEVLGEDGDTDQTTATLSVAESDEELNATFQWVPTDPGTGETVEFDASDSSGNIVEYRWDFTGDGNIDQSADNAVVPYTYGEAGTRTVTLEIAGGSGNVDSTSREVTVGDDSDSPAPPEATLDVSTTNPVAGDAVTFDAGGSEGDIVEYDWTFGDGTEETTEEPTVTHTYDSSATFTVEVTVTDSANQTDTTSRELTVGSPDDDTDNGTDNGSDNGTDNGSDNGTDNGSDNGTDNGSDNGTDNGSDNGTDNGSDDNPGGSSDDSTDGTTDDDSEDGSGDGSGDGLGPGFGPVSALSGLGGAVYLLKRRLLDGEDPEE